MKKLVQTSKVRSMVVAVSAALLLNACAPIAPTVHSDAQPPEVTATPEVAPVAVAIPKAVPERRRVDPMADVPGDKPLPVVQGAIERIDCMSGKEDLHARMAFEARGGQVANFAYYSKWKPRTCSFDFARTSPDTKWRLTSDGATRVYTPHGRFLIRTRADAYVFEFEQVDRRKYCGMPGEINGTMTIKRDARKSECSVAGIMDTNDSYLDALYKKR